MRLLQRDKRSTYYVSRAPIKLNLASVETYPYPKSQNSPLEFDIAVSDILVETFHV